MKQNGNDDLIVLNHASITYLCIAAYKTTAGTAQSDLHLHLSHLADALIQSDLQIGAFTL
jgi:hypothetical protein